jgi:hypothetical protein
MSNWASGSLGCSWTPPLLSSVLTPERLLSYKCRTDRLRVGNGGVLRPRVRPLSIR